jgi:hypothetical protein
MLTVVTHSQPGQHALLAHPLYETEQTRLGRAAAFTTCHPSTLLLHPLSVVQQAKLGQCSTCASFAAAPTRLP